MLFLGHEVSQSFYATHSGCLPHGPFAMWLVKASRPRVIAELGSYDGYSYFTFCQAVREAGLTVRGFAVGAWGGDELTEFCQKDAFKIFEEHNPRYSKFSSLFLKNSTDALEHIEDGSVDLLHVDGGHYYTGLKKDFKLWGRKLSDRAIVLLHGTNSRESGPEAWECWQELTREHPRFDFPFQRGLGVLFWGRSLGEEIQKFHETAGSEFGRDTLILMFQVIGASMASQPMVQGPGPLAIGVGSTGAIPIDAAPHAV